MSEFDPPSPAASRHRLIAITLDQSSIGRGNLDIEREREVAIYDILDANAFELIGRDDGPYKLVLGIQEDRLVLSIGTEAADGIVSHVLSLTPLRRVMKDYFLVCETYYQAIRSQPPSKIQAIDMGRRALHNEGSQLLIERLDGKVRLDTDTSRRLFTLICALHWKG
jgi:uncharacterized protein (UPF0262 family)